MMNKVKTAIIGVGNIGSAHASAIFDGKVAGMTLCALCDCDDVRLAECKKSFPGVSLFKNTDELFASGKAEAVIIAVPHPLHARLATAAFQNGLHVLVEKPADCSLSAAKVMCTEAKKSGKIFAIMLNQRTNPLLIKAHELVKSGAIGELKRSVWIVTNWYRTQAYYDSCNWRATWSGEGGGVLVNQAPHNLDLWQWICGMPISVRADLSVGRYHNIEVEDDATLTVHFPGGAIGTFITSTGEMPGTNRLEISGSKGKLVLENGKLTFWKLTEDEREFCFQNNSPFATIPATVEEYSESDIPDGHLLVLNNFSDAILHGKQLIAPGEDGLCELTISNAAYLSAWNGNTEITLPFDTTLFDQKLSELAKKSTKKNQSSDKPIHDTYLTRWQTRW